MLEACPAPFDRVRDRTNGWRAHCAVWPRRGVRLFSIEFHGWRNVVGSEVAVVDWQGYCDRKSNPDISPIGEMIVSGFALTTNDGNEAKMGCLFKLELFPLESKTRKSKSFEGSRIGDISGLTGRVER